MRKKYSYTWCNSCTWYRSVRILVVNFPGSSRRTHLSKVSSFVYLMDIQCIISAQGAYGALERPEDLWAENLSLHLVDHLWGFSGTLFYRWIRLRLIYLHPSYSSEYHKNRKSQHYSSLRSIIHKFRDSTRIDFSIAYFRVDGKVGGARDTELDIVGDGITLPAVVIKAIKTNVVLLS